jgi:hypothetical protein
MVNYQDLLNKTYKDITQHGDYYHARRSARLVAQAGVQANVYLSEPELAEQNKAEWFLGQLLAICEIEAYILFLTWMWVVVLPIWKE